MDQILNLKFTKLQNGQKKNTAFFIFGDKKYDRE